MDELEKRLKVVPAQADAVEELAVTAGFGFTVTVSVNGMPLHKFT
jgi:hypothetical protein